MVAGQLDTSVVIDWHDPAVADKLPDEMAISAITVAELAAGPLLASTHVEAAKRQSRLQEVESLIEPISFDDRAARSYGLIVAAIINEGRKPPQPFRGSTDRRYRACSRPGRLHPQFERLRRPWGFGSRCGGVILG
ncbi:PIN domain-containing protein [Mycolicibacterium sp. Dal123E01]|uniref:PIN domain-containing protein n=1 Tax=Mycolicibacterium sp. Dal123E01 TaxID=3457578 RepID=UPI00403E6391